MPLFVLYTTLVNRSDWSVHVRKIMMITEEEEGGKSVISASISRKVAPSIDLPQMKNGEIPSSSAGVMRSRFLPPAGQNGVSHPRPRSVSGTNNPTLDPIDEDSRYMNPNGPVLCRHESLELSKIGKQTSRKISLQAVSETLRGGFRPREFLKGRLASRARYRNRLVQKGGYCNISLVNVPKQRRKYFSDIFTTLVDVKWRWCLLVFSLSFLITWLLFSVIYYFMAMAHGDLEAVTEPNWVPCINNGNSYLNILIFSIASQHTIGWGYRYPTDACPEVIFTICIQSMIGVMIQTLMAGVVFAKLARPKKRAETLIFSKSAVICMQDGKLCFLCRVGDMRKSPLAEAHVRLQMIKNRITDEGELLPFHQFDIDCGFDNGTDRVFVIWPITICHVINEQSPLYDLSKDGLQDARFEIVVILEGVVESTGSTTQARTSYLPSEIQWGFRFEKLVTYQRENGNYRIDFGKFHETYPVNTTEFSAMELDEMRKAGLKPEEAFKCDSEEVENMGVTPCSTIHHGSVDHQRPLLSQIFQRRFKELEENAESNETV